MFDHSTGAFYHQLQRCVRDSRHLPKRWPSLHLLDIPACRLYSRHTVTSIRPFHLRKKHSAPVVLLVPGEAYWHGPESNGFRRPLREMKDTSPLRHVCGRYHCCCTFQPHRQTLPRLTSPVVLDFCRPNNLDHSGTKSDHPYAEDQQSFLD